MAFTEIASSRVRQALENASDANGLLGFNQFVEIALYHKDFGYYRARRKRVGRNPESDFYTASSLKKAFGPILMEASIGLLEKSGFDPKKVTWVEIGAEPGSSLIDEVDSPFQTSRTIRAGETISLEGDLIVFSNELFDALPFNRVTFRDGAWLERFIEISDQGLKVVEQMPFSPGVVETIGQLPQPAPEGYIIDLPTATRPFMESIVAQPWQGAFIAFDYGKTWRSLTHDTPQGTARAYRHHQQSSNLLDHIGQQDLTCHVCWDWLEESLDRAGFQSIELESQESFILKRAPAFVRRAFESGSGMGSEMKGELRQLIHPTLMGQRFQSLSGVRTDLVNLPRPS